MRALVLFLILCSSAVAQTYDTRQPATIDRGTFSTATVTVTVELPVVVAEALSATAASNTLAGQPTTLQQLCAAILSAQAEQIAQAAVVQEQQRRRAAKDPQLIAWKRRVAMLADKQEAKKP